MGSRNMLKQQQRQQLREWLEAERPKLAKKQAKIHTAAILATKALGFKVTRNNINWMAEKHHLHWHAWQVPSKKHAWRCPHCGGLMNKKLCGACDLNRSQRKNQETANRHGLKWLTQLCKGSKGR